MRFSEELAYEVLSVVEEIPLGKVASYGQLVRLVGREKNARLIGKILSRGDCWRMKALFLREMAV